jgi:membrane associated rhomboid family serine protease
VGEILSVNPESLSPPVVTFPLRGGRRALTLHASGLRHTASWLAGGEGFTGFDEITDVALGSRGLKIGTLRNVLLLPRRLFLDAGAPDRLAQVVIERIGALPDGPAQLARMAELEQFARRGGSLRATWVAIAVCVAVYGLGGLLGPNLHDEGHFGATLFFAGEYWRLVSGNFLHGGLGHLILNVLGLWVLGDVVERPLGASRAALIMAASALGAMGAEALAGHEDSVGASGIVCGLAGAALFLELRVPERLPAAWRLPRRLFFTALAVDAAISAFVPFVAGAAHLGGFLAGILVAWALTPRAPMTAWVPSWVRGLAAAAVLLLAGSGITVAREIAGGPDVVARRAERLLSLPAVPPVMLNNAAWMIATAPSPTQAQIQIALRSAQRAVAQTDRADPNFLDTLAETQFLAGRSEDALETIDEAIALAPGESYFLEQRRRFTGERAYGDRPAPPGEPGLPGEPAEPWLDEPPQRRLPPGHPPIEEDPGISV